MFQSLFNPNYVGFFNIATPLLIIFLVWSSIWKGVALWKSARRGQKVWFLVILLVNSLGILELIYLGFFLKKTSKRK